MTRNVITLPWLDPDIDLSRLRGDGAYRAGKWALYQSNPSRWAWYITVHSHTCPRCGQVRSHTGFEATLDPNAHTCCGHDMRGR